MIHVGKALPFVFVLAFGVTTACVSTPARDDNANPAGGATPHEQGGEQGGAQQAPANAGDFQKQEVERLTLQEQKNKILIDQHLENARALMADVRLEEARNEITLALDLEPDHAEARELLNQVGALMGDQSGVLGTGRADLEAQYQVQLQSMRADAEESFNKAKLLLARGDYDGAIGELTVVQNHIRWAPSTVDWNGIDQEVAKTLEAAKAQKSGAEKAARDKENREAQARLKEQEKAERDRRDAAVSNLLDQAIGAFEATKYDKAMDYADQVLRRDPRNEKAQEIRDAAFRAGREQVREDYVRAKREQFKRWQEELSEARVPYTDVIKLPDEDFWNDLTAKRSTRRGIDLSQAMPESERALREQLATTRIPGLTVQQEESLTKVIDIIRTLTGLPLVVDPAAETAATEAGVVFDLALQNPLTVEQALNIVTKACGDTVSWTVKHDAVIVTTKTKARGELVIYNHDVQDLVFGLTDFTGPRIDRVRLLDDMKDDDGGGPFGGVGESPSPIDVAQLKALIQENVEPGSWEQEGVRIDEGEGHILVVHSPEVQAKVKQFLNDLRRFNSSLVTIESKFMTVASNWIQEIGVDLRGLDNPGTPFTDLDDFTNGQEDATSRGLDNGGTGSSGSNGSGPPSAGFFYNDGQDGDFKGHIENFFSKGLGDKISNIGGMTAQLTFLNDLQVSAILRAVEKSTEYQLVNDQVLSVHNTERAFVSVINQQAYIQDFDVEVAQFQAVADPQVNVLTEGVVLDVRPTILYDRKYLRLEIQPTVAKVVALRPFSSTLGGNTSPVEFQLPELEVQSVFTTAVIPDGGSILLGGLTNLRNVQRKAEVPWLAKIPLVGFFFKQEGYDDENKTLMILIKAHITDVRDELAKLEARR
ncbi:MAG: hypothetical protein K8S98_04915 [Planctomycetes bacterium]|nr:hypothetical protein [Planctomycetota bacterium]